MAGNASGIDDHVERRPIGKEGFDGIGVGHIQANGVNRMPGSFHRIDAGRKLLHAARRAHHMGALLGQRHSAAKPNAA
jgi:hypothetical protein